MKAWELIKALEEGKSLTIEHHNDPECIEILKLESYQHPGKIVKRLEIYGWGSAYGFPINRIEEMMRDPEYASKWKVQE